MSQKFSPLRQPAAPASAGALVPEVAGLVVAALNLDVAPADIDADAPLYGEGLGLDSIDILEIALVVSKQYGVQLRADSEENERIFGSLRQLADYIDRKSTRLNSSHSQISYAVFCLKKKKIYIDHSHYRSMPFCTPAMHYKRYSLTPNLSVSTSPAAFHIAPASQLHCADAPNVNAAP